MVRGFFPKWDFTQIFTIQYGQNPLVNYTDWFAMHLYVSGFCSVWHTVESFRALMLKNKGNFFNTAQCLQKALLYENV
jgi:hypothetical protein